MKTNDRIKWELDYYRKLLFPRDEVYSEIIDFIIESLDKDYDLYIKELHDKYGDIINHLECLRRSKQLKTIYSAASIFILCFALSVVGVIVHLFNIYA